MLVKIASFYSADGKKILNRKRHCMMYQFVYRFFNSINSTISSYLSKKSNDCLINMNRIHKLFALFANNMKFFKDAHSEVQK